MHVVSVNVGRPRTVQSKVKRFIASGRTGHYLAVSVEGRVGAGDPIVTLGRHPARIPVAEITRRSTSDRHLRRSLATDPE